MLDINNKETFLGRENVHNLIILGIMASVVYNFIEPKFKKNELRVWWREESEKMNFQYVVGTPTEAFLILKMFKEFEHFQRVIKIDKACNFGGLLVYKKQPKELGVKQSNYSWVEWESKRGKNIDHYLKQKAGLRNLKRALNKSKTNKK
jgi:hypothetical protein